MKGGKKEGAGRPKGALNKTTLEQNIIKNEIHGRVLKGHKKLINSQFNLASGCAYLYKVDKDSKGKDGKPRLITTQGEIEKYLSGDYKETEEYYFITTDKPDMKALQDLWDRVIGKPKENLEVNVLNMTQLLKSLNEK